MSETRNKELIEEQLEEEYVPTEADIDAYLEDVKINDELLGIVPDNDESDITKATQTNPRIPFDR